MTSPAAVANHSDPPAVAMLVVPKLGTVVLASTRPSPCRSPTAGRRGRGTRRRARAGSRRGRASSRCGSRAACATAAGPCGRRRPPAPPPRPRGRSRGRRRAARRARARARGGRAGRPSAPSRSEMAVRGRGQQPVVVQDGAGQLAGLVADVVLLDDGAGERLDPDDVARPPHPRAAGAGEHAEVDLLAVERDAHRDPVRRRVDPVQRPVGRPEEAAAPAQRPHAPAVGGERDRAGRGRTARGPARRGRSAAAAAPRRSR